MKVDVVLGCKASRKFGNRMLLKTDIFCDGEPIANEVTHIPFILSNLDELESKYLSMNIHRMAVRRVKKLCKDKGITPDAINLIWVYNYNCLRYDNVDFPHDNLVHNYISSVDNNYGIRSMDTIARRSSDYGIVALSTDFGFKYLHELVGTAVHFFA